jgi:hypothetical protein
VPTHCLLQADPLILRHGIAMFSQFSTLFDRHGLGEIARLIYVAAATHGNVVGEQL